MDEKIRKECGFSEEQAIKVDKWMEANKQSLAEKGRPICPKCMKPMRRKRKDDDHSWKCKCFKNMTISVG